MTDPRYPGSGQPYGGGYPSGAGQSGGSDPYGAPNPYGAPSPYGSPDPYSGQPYQSPGQYGGSPGQYGGSPGQYGSPYNSPYNPYGSPSPYGTPPKKGSGGKVAAIIIGALVLIGALSAGGFYYLQSKNKNNTATPATSTASTHDGSSKSPRTTATTPSVKTTDPTNARVGDCLAGQTMDSSTAEEVSDIKIVPCTAADAKYKVVGIVAGKTEAQFKVDDHLCDAYPSAVSVLWQGRTGGAGSVLCLAAVKK